MCAYPDHMSSSCQPRQSRSTAEIALCASLGAVLLAAGIGKSLNLDSRLFMQSFLPELLGNSRAALLAVAALEMLAGVLLIFGRCIVPIASCVALAMPAFALLYLLRAAPEQACGCFGGKAPWVGNNWGVPAQALLIGCSAGYLLLSIRARGAKTGDAAEAKLGANPPSARSE